MLLRLSANWNLVILFVRCWGHNDIAMRLIILFCFFLILMSLYYIFHQEVIRCIGMLDRVLKIIDLFSDLLNFFINYGL